MTDSTTAILTERGYFLATAKDGQGQLIRALAVASITPHPHAEHGKSVVVTTAGQHYACQEAADELIGRWQHAAKEGRALAGER